MAKILFLITAADHWTLADGFEQPAASAVPLAQEVVKTLG